MADPVKPWRLLPPLILLVSCWLLVFWPWLAGLVTIPWDAKSQFYPQLVLLARGIHGGELPWWNPFVFAGTPQIADPQSLIFSPPFLLLALASPEPSFRAFDTTVLLTLLAGGIAVLLFARDRGWHYTGAVTGGLVFACGGSAYWRLQHVGEVVSLAFFAMALWPLQRALERRSMAWGLGAGVAAGLMLIGRDQVALLCAYALAGFVLAHLLIGQGILARLAASAAPLLAMALSTLLVAGGPVLLTLLLAADSNRPEIDLPSAGAGSLHPALLITLLVPHLFGPGGPMADYWGPPSSSWNGTGLFLAQNMGVVYAGAIPLLLILGGMLRPRGLWQPDRRFFSLAPVIALIYALGWYTPAFQVIHAWLPGADLFRRPADATFVFCGLLAYLVAALTNDLITTGPKVAITPRRIAPLLGALVVVAALTLAWLMGRTSLAMPALATAAGSLLLAVIVLLSVRRLTHSSRSLACCLLAIALAADLAWSHRPNGATGLPPAMWEVLDRNSGDATLAAIKSELTKDAAPDRRDRVELVGLGYAWPNAPIVHGIEHTLGHNPVRLKLYNDAVGADDTIAVPEQRHFTPAFPSYDSILARLLGLRLIASSVPIEQVDPKLRPGALHLLRQTDTAYLYENPGTLPRVLMVGDARAADFDAIARTGVWPENNFREAVLLAELPSDAPKEPRPAGQASIDAYRQNEVLIEANSTFGGYVVLHDMWHPWWRAEVDGMPVPVMRANLLFRSVAVPPGRHEVRFYFDPIAGAARDVERRWPWAAAIIDPLRALLAHNRL